MTKILVTGASGQLGMCFRKHAPDFPQFEFIFADSKTLDLSLFGVISTYFRENNFDYCINCAAYTNVEQAETDREKAFLVNSDAVKNLAEVCENTGTTLFHFSTDYVFDGKKDSAYSEEDEPNPINVYGASKLSGEQYVQEVSKRFFILRTSWLYSDNGHNFYNSIRKKIEVGEDLKITTTQKGTPTNAYDLALFVLNIIAEGNTEFGIYHYSNLGEATWYDFAEEILKLSGKAGKVKLLENNNFTTLASRPVNSVLSKTKVLKTFKQEILSWQESLVELSKREI